LDRRAFLNNSSLAFLTAALADLSPDLELQARTQDKNSSNAQLGQTFQLNKKNDPEEVKSVYEIGSKEIGPSAAPYVYAFYDEDAKKFVSPLNLKPTLKKNSYTLEPILHAFNIRKADQANFKKLKNQVQLGFNATAPVTKSDQLSWVFMNAIDIFLAKDNSGRQDQLTKFTNSNGKNSTPLVSSPKISVTSGTVSLQITAFGQKQDSIWLKLFDFVTKAVNSPIVSTASKGFGVPGLATEALTFVNGVLDVIAQQNKLVDLWKTGSLEFAVTEDVSGRFGIRPGLWANVDSDYARQTNFLEGHAVDFLYQSFRITDKAGKPVDANYLVADLKFSA
jgi:hypothetical protein